MTVYTVVKVEHRYKTRTIANTIVNQNKISDHIKISHKNAHLIPHILLVPHEPQCSQRIGI
jgi:hypothetical protein